MSDESSLQDDSPLLDEDGKSKFMNMIGALQWAITLGQFDISVAVTCISRFCSEPREGHLE